jgi:ABC-type transport system involved in multi-copper enzyme maturation permease subunit
MKEKKTGDFVGAVVVNIIVCVILNTLLLAFYHPPRLQALTRALFAAAGLLSAIVFFIVFPMDFSRLVGSWLNTLLKVLLTIGIGVSLIAFVIECVRFIPGRPIAQKPHA